MTTDSDYTPPPRSVLYARPVPPEEGGGAEVACDCGTVTQVIVEGAELLTEAQEMSFVCEGCQSVHWFTIGPLEKMP